MTRSIYTQKVITVLVAEKGSRGFENIAFPWLGGGGPRSAGGNVKPASGPY
jgi:hypothetical protein